MKHSYKHLYWLLALLAAFSFDQLFWQKPGGINFFIFVLLAILGGLIPIWLEKIPIPWTSTLLLLPIGGFALMTFFRAEPFTNVMNGLITLGALILFTITLLNGAWVRFNIRDHLVNLFKFSLNCFAGGILFFIKVKKDPVKSRIGEPEGEEAKTNPESGTETVAAKETHTRKYLPYLRGVLLALPILAVLTLLLAAADPVFYNRIQNLFSWFDLDKLGEYIFRLVYIVVIAYLLLSAYFFGLVESKKWQKTDPSKPWLRPFLGSVEAWIIMGGVNLLFLLFVILQFTYLFGGTSNISIEGFTYAEYARRGFFELLAVALISLLLFYVLSLLTKRESIAQRWTFSGLGLMLVSLAGIILASAYTRLTLYEAAYGFTRLRTMTHIFMIWTGLLLLAIAILEILRKMDRLAIILICFIFGFGLTVNLLNIDRFIVRQNVTRALKAPEDDAGYELDTGYLYSLSYDSIPPLVTFYKNAATPERVRDDIGGVLACRLASLDLPAREPWSSTHFSRSKAITLLQEHTKELETYPISENWDWFVEVNDEVRSCVGYGIYETPPD